MEKHFKFFDLSTDATIHDVDEIYATRTDQIHKMKAEQPELAKQQQRKVDDHYNVLLKEFIRRDCQKRQYEPAMNLSMTGVILRSYEPNVIKSTKETAGSLNVKFNSNKQSIRSAKDDALSQDNGRLNDEGHCESEVGLEVTEPSEEKFMVTEWEGDIFDAPNNAVIVHAVNCQGVWGSGFAAELRKRFPAAYQDYAHWCRTTEPKHLLVGGCLLIPPQPADYASRDKPGLRRWIACLFTSEGFGRANPCTKNPGKDDKETILMHTDSSLSDLRTDLDKFRNTNTERNPVDLYSPRFNAGSFDVPWEDTKTLIEAAFADYAATWHVISRPKNEDWSSQPES